jgi:hypothetical protein
MQWGCQTREFAVTDHSRRYYNPVNARGAGTSCAMPRIALQLTAVPAWRNPQSGKGIPVVESGLSAAAAWIASIGERPPSELIRGGDARLHNSQGRIDRSAPAGKQTTRSSCVSPNLRRRSAKPESTIWRNSLTARPKPVLKNGRFADRNLMRTGARESSSWPGARSTSRPDTLLQTILAIRRLYLTPSGGPYIF